MTSVRNTIAPIEKLASDLGFLTSPNLSASAEAGGRSKAISGSFGFLYDRQKAIASIEDDVVIGGISIAESESVPDLSVTAHNNVSLSVQTGRVIPSFPIFSQPDDAIAQSTGGSFAVVLRELDAIASVKNATTQIDGLKVRAVQSGLVFLSSAAGGIGAASQSATNLSFVYHQSTANTQALIDSNARLAVAGHLDVSAHDGIWSLVTGGALSRSTGSSVGVTVLIDQQTRDVSAKVAVPSLSVDGNASIESKRDALSLVTAISASVSSAKPPSTSGPALSSASLSGPSFAGASSGVGQTAKLPDKPKSGLGVSGAGIGTTTTETLTAQLKLTDAAGTVSQVGGDLNLATERAGHLVLVAGGLAVASGRGGSKGIAGVTIYQGATETRKSELMSGGNDLSVGGALTLRDTDRLSTHIWAIGAAAATGSKATGITASVVVSDLNITTKVSLRGDFNLRVSKLDLQSNLQGMTNQVVGAAVGSSGNSVGGAFSVAARTYQQTVSLNDVQVTLDKADSVASIRAQNAHSLANVAAGIAVSTGGNSGAAMVAFTSVKQAQWVDIDNVQINGGAYGQSSTERLSIEALSG